MNKLHLRVLADDNSSQAGINLQFLSEDDMKYFLSDYLSRAINHYKVIMQVEMITFDLTVDGIRIQKGNKR